MTEIRFEGITLIVENVEKSLVFYRDTLGFTVEIDASPAFALLLIGSGTIGLLSQAQAAKEGAQPLSAAPKTSVHIELSTDNLDKLYEELRTKGVVFSEPPHDEPWERSMTAVDPDGFSLEFAQGRRGMTRTE